MQKNIAILSIVLALVVGVGIGYAGGEVKGRSGEYGYKGMMGGNTHMMSDGKMMDNDDAGKMMGSGSATKGMSMDSMMMSMNAGLVGKTGDDFDKAFLSEMIVHHQGAVSMAELALKNAKHQEIKDLATGIISAQNKEIAEMKSWASNWYNQ